MPDSVEVPHATDPACLWLVAGSQQVSQGLVVHLQVGGLQAVLPPLAAQQLHLLQNLQQGSCSAEQRLQ